MWIRRVAEKKFKTLLTIYYIYCEKTQWLLFLFSLSSILEPCSRLRDLRGHWKYKARANVDALKSKRLQSILSCSRCPLLSVPLLIRPLADTLIWVSKHSFAPYPTSWRRMHHSVSPVLGTEIKLSQSVRKAVIRGKHWLMHRVLHSLTHLSGHLLMCYNDKFKWFCPNNFTKVTYWIFHI